MKKLLLTLLCIIGALTLSAETWSYTVAKDSSNKYSLHSFSTTYTDGVAQTVKFNIGSTADATKEMEWSLKITAISSSSKPNISNDGTSPLAILIGAAASPAKEVVLSTDKFTDKIIKNVKVKVKGGAKVADYGLSLNVGDSSYGAPVDENGADVKVSGSSEVIASWPTNATGEIAIVMTNNLSTTGSGKNAGIGICAIEVTYAENTGGDVVVVAKPTISHEEGLVSIAPNADNDEIYYTVDGSDPTAESTKYVASFQVEQNTVVKAICINADGAASAIATQTITWVKTKYASIAEVLADAPSDVITFTCPLTAIYQNGQNLYVTDGTDFILVYGDVDQTYTNGDIIPAGAQGKYSPFNGLPEIGSPANFAAATAGTPVEPAVLTASQISQGLINHYVLIKGATIEEYDSSKNGTLTDASGSITARSNYHNEETNNLTGNKNYYGFVGYYVNSKTSEAIIQFIPTFAEEVVLAADVAEVFYMNEEDLEISEDQAEVNLQGNEAWVVFEVPEGHDLFYLIEGTAQGAPQGEFAKAEVDDKNEFDLEIADNCKLQFYTQRQDNDEVSEITTIIFTGAAAAEPELAIHDADADDMGVVNMNGGELTIKFLVPDGHDFYYKHVNTPAEEKKEAPRRAEALDHTGYTHGQPDEDGIVTIPVKYNSTLSYYTVHQLSQTKSEEQTLTFAGGNTSSIAEIEVAKQVDTFDLFGRKVGTSARGILIRQGQVIIR